VAQRYRDQGASAYLYFGPDPHGGRVGEAVELSYKMVPHVNKSPILTPPSFGRSKLSSPIGVGTPRRLTATGPMAEAVNLSTSKMTDDVAFLEFRQA
jgi:hypothetical protein